MSHLAPSHPHVPLSAVSDALRVAQRTFTGGHWRLVALAADGDTVSLRVRFTGPATTAVAVLVREGEHWSLDWAGTTAVLRHTTGLGHLHALLCRPGAEVHALALASAGGTPAGAADPDLDVGGTDTLGPLLDDTARDAYRRRLAELREDIADADACHDTGRAAKARRELDALTRHLAQAFGLGGRARPVGSAAERARINVTRALRAAIARITESFPDLGHHLDTTVRTGTFCGYDPGPRPEVNWRLR